MHPLPPPPLGSTPATELLLVVPQPASHSFTPHHLQPHHWHHHNNSCHYSTHHCFMDLVIWPRTYVPIQLLFTLANIGQISDLWLMLNYCTGLEVQACSCCIWNKGIKWRNSCIFRERISYLHCSIVETVKIVPCTRISTVSDTTSTGIWCFPLTAALTLVTLTTITLWIKRRIIHLKLHTNCFIFFAKTKNFPHRVESSCQNQTPKRNRPKSRLTLALQNDTTSTLQTDDDIVHNEMPRTILIMVKFMANHQQVHPENTTLSQWNGIVYFISVECHGEQTYSQQQLSHTWRNVLVRHLICRFLPV